MLIMFNNQLSGNEPNPKCITADISIINCNGTKHV